MIKKLFLISLLLLFFLLKPIQADDQLCLDCHSVPTLTTERNSKVISLFVSELFQNSTTKPGYTPRTTGRFIQPLLP